MAITWDVKEKTSPPSSRFWLPGLNLPIDWSPDVLHRQEYRHRDKMPKFSKEHGEGRNLFCNSLTEISEEDSSCGRMTTLREFTMMQIMDSLTDKKGWEDKVFDDSIANKWKEELLAIPEMDISQKMVDFIIAELRFRAPSFRKNGMFMVYEGSVVKSDIAVPSSVKDALIAEVKCLENVPEKYKDYHPGSDGKVVDLVHPSLFPLIYGRSKVLAAGETISKDDCISSIGLGDVIPISAEPLDSAYSDRFQWLPCDLKFIDNGSGVEITSYINNLHPEKHGGLYKAIEKIISSSIPLWNLTLSHARQFEETPYPRIIFTEFEQEFPEENRPQQAQNEDEDDYMDRVMEWERQEVIITQPEPVDFDPSGGFSDYLEGLTQFYKPKEDDPEMEYIVDLQRDYQHRGLQVIVKLATIELTPEKPEYTGGTWHVEGQLNEHICATALYYYQSTNITESRLSFRQRCDTEVATVDIHYPQNEHQFLPQIFGCEDYEAVQEVGSVNCLQGRLLTFPNILQHRVEPFRLADATKPGTRKIVALFLVDPNIRVISTANVPPQQKEWWAEELLKRGEFKSLSRELQDQIFDKVDDFPIGLNEAKKLREELMDERRSYVVEADEAFRSLTFSLCEH